MILSTFFPKDISNISDIDIIHGVMKNAVLEAENKYIMAHGTSESRGYLEAMVDVAVMVDDLYFARGDKNK
jgi:hypothetical protein